MNVSEHINQLQSHLTNNNILFYVFQTLFSLFQTVAITERKQRCGLSGELVTTKICFTYPDASWVCRQPRTDRDCDR